MRLLLAQAQEVGAEDLARARRQILVRHLRQLDRPAQRLEAAALELLATGRVRSHAEVLAALQAVSAAQVRDCFAAMIAAGAAVAVAGKLPRGTDEQLRRLAAPLLHARPPGRAPAGRRRFFAAVDRS